MSTGFVCQSHPVTLCHAAVFVQSVGALMAADSDANTACDIVELARYTQFSYQSFLEYTNCVARTLHGDSVSTSASITTIVVAYVTVVIGVSIDIAGITR